MIRALMFAALALVLMPARIAAGPWWRESVSISGEFPARGIVNTIRIDDRLYAFFADMSMQILNMKEPLNPTVIGSAYGFEGVPHQIRKYGNLGLATHFKGMEIINLANESAPYRMAFQPLPDGFHAYDSILIGNLAHILSSHGIIVVDLSNPSIPAWIHYSPLRGGTKFHPVGNYYATESAVFDLSNPADIKTVDEPAFLRNHPVGNRDYDGSTVYMILPDNTRHWVGELPVKSSVNEMDVIDDFLFVASNDGFYMLDARDPNGLDYLRSYLYVGPVTGVQAFKDDFNKNYAVWITANGRLILVNSTASRSFTNDAELVAATIPSNVQPGQVVPFSIRMRHTGSGFWLSYHSLALISNPAQLNAPLRISHGKVSVPNNINLDREVTFTGQFTAPTTPGSYNLKYQMVHEFVEFFGPQVDLNFTVGAGRRSKR